MLVVCLHVCKIDSTTDNSLKRIDLLLHNIIKDQLTIFLLTLPIYQFKWERAKVGA